MYKPVRRINYKLILSSCFSAAVLGHLYGRFRSSSATSEFMTPYESEDQVHHILDTTDKPVVLYYYLGYLEEFPEMRKVFTNLAYKNRDKCSWMMVSYKKNAFHINNNIRSFTNYPMIQIRFPKQTVQETDENGVVHTMEVYPSQEYGGRMNMRPLRHFLEMYGLSGTNDAVRGLREASQRVMFGEVFTK